jgi:hypothetical protein
LKILAKKHYYQFVKLKKARACPLSTNSPL